MNGKWKEKAEMKKMEGSLTGTTKATETSVRPGSEDQGRARRRAFSRLPGLRSVAVVAVGALERREAENRAAEVERTIPKAALRSHGLTLALAGANRVSLLLEKLMETKDWW